MTASLLDCFYPAKVEWASSRPWVRD